MNPSISILIPSFQAGHMVPALVHEINSLYPDLSVLVIDDGSTDGTPERLTEAGCQFIRIDKNSGKGFALRKGIELTQTDWVLCLDADFQHDPADIKKFSEEIQNFPEADLLIGQRTFSDPMPVHRRWSNQLTSLLTGVRTGHRIPDVQCGFRALRLQALPRFQWQNDGYIFETEMVIKALKAGCKVRWIPIKTIYNNSPSYIRPWETVSKFITLWFFSFFWPDGNQTPLSKGTGTTH